jgi:hypothetical protein
MMLTLLLLLFLLLLLLFLLLLLLLFLLLLLMLLLKNYLVTITPHRTSGMMATTNGATGPYPKVSAWKYFEN